MVLTVHRNIRSGRLFCTSFRLAFGQLNPLNLSEVTRHLGVTVTKSLTWPAHIDNILNRVNYKTFVLKRLAWKCPNSTFVRRSPVSLPGAACPWVLLPWPKKRTILEIRGEKNAVPRVISCSITSDQRRARSDPRLSATFALRWSRVIEHDITRGTAFFSPRISKMVLFLARVVVCGSSLGLLLQGWLSSSRRLQVSVARSVVRLGRRSSSSSDILKQIGWPTLAWRRRRYKLLFLWKILNGHGPPSLLENMPATVDEPAHQSFRRKTLEMSMCRMERRRQSFLPSSTALWNKLPDSVTFCTSSCSILASLDSFYDADKYSFGLA